MSNSTHFSAPAPIFQGRALPTSGWVVGYAYIISQWELPIPMPCPMAMVSEKTTANYSASWIVLPKQYLPPQEDNPIQQLYHQLVFALKYEGVNLLVFSALSRQLDAEQQLALVGIEPSGQYSRRIWFLLEWVSGKEITGKESASRKAYVPAVDEKLQYAIQGQKSPRHMVMNNLPGVASFCPLIRKTAQLEAHLAKQYGALNEQQLGRVRKELLQRTSAFLMLQDSKASFAIEGESPKSRRASLWGAAIGQAGSRELSIEELTRLQQLVIENPRFVHIGLREQGGFVGEHDRLSGEPIPSHISARPEDLPTLLQGLVDASLLLAQQPEFDAVLAAAQIAFGFVFIHPFEDGNGRIHRYLIHHMLAKKSFAAQGMVFPVSSAILSRIDDYRRALEAYSQPLLAHIDWEETADHNVHVRHDSRDFYRFFDATPQAEFLFDCVADTIEEIIPEEVRYLTQYDAFRLSVQEAFGMPDKMIASLSRFLQQQQGRLSQRAQMQEFSQLTPQEVQQIEQLYAQAFS